MVEQIHDQGIVGAVLVLEQFLGVGQEFFWNVPLENCSPRSIKFLAARSGES